LKPEPEDAEKIRKKLVKGLPVVAQARQVKRVNEVQKRAERAKKSSEVKNFPFQ
jgi:hypothetical protein